LQWVSPLYHPGSAQIYLSKAENGDLSTYKGDGDWFKIQNIGTTDGKTWDLWNKENVGLTLCCWHDAPSYEFQESKG
jgi:hypothetical protein